MKQNILLVSSLNIFKKIKEKSFYNKFNISYLKVIDLKPLNFKIKNKRYDWIVFTSFYGVHFFLKKVKKDFFKNKKIATIGKETAKALKDFNLKVDFIPSKYDSISFKKEFKTNLKTKNILFISPLKNQKTKKNNNIDYLNVYKNILNKVKIKEKNKILKNRPYSFIVFTSPSNFLNFKKNLGEIYIDILKESKVIAIGKITEKEIKKDKIKIILPKRQTIKSIFDEIKKYNLFCKGEKNEFSSKQTKKIKIK